jgi:hypothetical protein
MIIAERLHALGITPVMRELDQNLLSACVQNGLGATSDIVRHFSAEAELTQLPTLPSRQSTPTYYCAGRNGGQAPIERVMLRRQIYLIGNADDQMSS